MNRLNWKVAALAAIAGAAFITSFALASAFASTASLTASCSGVVSGATVTWTATSTGGNAPYSFLWSGDPSVAGSTGTSIVYTYGANGIYSAGVTATDASSTTAAASCSATVSSIATSTPPEPRIKPAMLSINPEGHFLAHGMIVTSIASNSFQAQVWGITYTVNWSGSLNRGDAELWFREGPASPTSKITNQLKVGDEVGVSGLISSSSPLVVSARVVRDYSIVYARSEAEMGGQGNGNAEGQGNGNENTGEGNVHSNVGATSSFNINQIQTHLEDLLNQLKGLQNLFRGNHGQ